MYRTHHLNWKSHLFGSSLGTGHLPSRGSRPRALDAHEVWLQPDRVEAAVGASANAKHELDPSEFVEACHPLARSEDVTEDGFRLAPRLLTPIRRAGDAEDSHMVANADRAATNIAHSPEPVVHCAGVPLPNGWPLSCGRA